MKRLFAAVMVLAALTSCASKEQRAADQVKSAVAAKLKDPDSAKFTELKVYLGSLCGEVNSKNSFGAYAGPEQFQAAGATSVMFRSEAVQLDAMLANTEAGKADRSAVDRFDDDWEKCQRAGVKVQ